MNTSRCVPALESQLIYAIALDEIQALSGGSPSGRMGELEEMVRDALEGAARVGKIVCNLKTFSRADEETRSVSDVRPTIELAINMAFNEICHCAKARKGFRTNAPDRR